MSNSVKEQIEIINQQLKELAGIYQDAVGVSDISVNEFWIWYALVVMGGEYSQQDICNAWSLSKQTVNTIIMNMAKKGFVTLEVVPGTRNRKLIRLTAAGRAYGESIVMPVSVAEERAFDKLSDDDKIAFSAILGRYIEALRDEFTLT